jgi:hypothetical protein
LSGGIPSLDPVLEMPQASSLLISYDSRRQPVAAAAAAAAARHSGRCMALALRRLWWPWWECLVSMTPSEWGVGTRVAWCAVGEWSASIRRWGAIHGGLGQHLLSRLVFSSFPWSFPNPHDGHDMCRHLPYRFVRHAQDLQCPGLRVPSGPARDDGG